MAGFKDKYYPFVGKFRLPIDFDWLYATFICNIVVVFYAI
jgi:hypothetical protein